MTPTSGAVVWRAPEARSRASKNRRGSSCGRSSGARRRSQTRPSKTACVSTPATAWPAGWAFLANALPGQREVQLTGADRRRGDRFRHPAVGHAVLPAELDDQVPDRLGFLFRQIGAPAVLHFVALDQLRPVP